MEARIIQWKLSVLPRGWGPIYTPAREATPLAGPDVQRGGETNSCDNVGRSDDEDFKNPFGEQLNFKNDTQKSNKNE